MKNNFSRSNVNESTLNVTMPDMSSFDLSHSSTVTPMLGKIYPVNFEPLLPRDIVTGSITAKLDLEKIATPSIGRVRLDSHTFAVSAHRINRDYKQFSEGMEAYTQLPSFRFWSFMDEYFKFIFGSNYSNVSTIPWFNSDMATFSEAHTSQVLTYQNTYSALCACICNSIRIRYAEIINTNPTGHGYSLDFLQSELDRLSSIYQTCLDAYTSGKSINFANTICEILKPLFGEGSLFDYLGYPILTAYSKHSICLSYLQESTVAANLDSVFTSLFDVVSLSKLLSVIYVDVLAPDFNFLQVVNDPLLDEMPLRAYYAVWYDYFRNFHVEKRTDVLDPDMFDIKPLIKITDVYSFLDVLQLITFRTRNFSRDFLTTIQTEDVFRYVYNPVLDVVNGEVTSRNDNSQASNNSVLNNIVDVLIQGNYTSYFPSNLINSQVNPTGGNETTVGVLKSDLQTMRRAGMLEKLLAREYFYPDTYAGKMLARYGIQPGDIDMLNSVYLSGSEQFISGDQLQASMSTTDTERGTRTLVAGVNTSDSFAFTCKDSYYLISVISLVPMVSYDAANLHLLEVHTNDIPLPQFATDTRVGVAPSDLLRGFGDQLQTIGYVPRYYGWRCHPDETHGRYLSDYRSFNWFRDWYNMNYGKLGVKVYEPDSHDFTLNPYSLRIALPIDAFIGLSPWDSIAFGKVDINCFVTRALPAAVETV